MKKNSFKRVVYYAHLFAIALTAVTFASCTNENEDIGIASTKQQSNIIDVQEIQADDQTRSTLLSEHFTKGYRCTSETSSVTADIYHNEECNETRALLVNNNNEVSLCLIFKEDGTKESGIILFTTYNEEKEPILSGEFNPVEATISITQIHGNDAITRASAASWGCNLGLLAAGAAWSIPAGMISGGLSFAISLAYSVAAIEICDRL